MFTEGSHRMMGINTVRSGEAVTLRFTYKDTRENKTDRPEILLVKERVNDSNSDPLKIKKIQEITRGLDVF